ncbi:hypothetical protein C8N46_102405 [Kordia periserrulae]|uniref:Uncharacterized protein n=1 Tax=Kordia periserrulae TaxID=701523 RepID=A0A2T6C3X2_9FLAO|nr:hypothetical protein [Kordia periserrulae]PTX63004.1 hypothetical protein C8N46_102405 [Kordia periserrulae]
MKQIGMYLAIFGIGSIVLYFFDMQFKILTWIDEWGETTGWAIRIGMIVLGAILFFIGKSKEEEQEEAPE